MVANQRHIVDYSVSSQFNQLPSVLDEGVVMSGVGLPAVHHHAHQFVVDLVAVLCDAGVDRQLARLSVAAGIFIHADVRVR